MRATSAGAFTAGFLLTCAASPVRGQQRTQLIAITDVTVIDGTGRRARPNATVVIRDGVIATIDSTSARVPSAASLVEGRGKFLIPGLWDMHVHLAKAGDTTLAVFVANGVTSVRDMGGDFAVVQRMRSEILSGRRIGPRIRTAGPILESAARVQRMKEQGTVEPVDRFRAPIADTTDAMRVVDSAARLGVDFIKVRTVASVETYQAIAGEARRRGLKLAAHGDIAKPEEMLRAGQTSMEHPIYPSLQRRDSAERARIVQELVAAGTAVVPTLVNYYQWLLVSPRDARRILDDSLGRIDHRRRYVSGYLLEDWREQIAERGGVMDAILRRVVYPRLFGGVLKDLQQMHRAGVRILPGTDVGVALKYPGFSLHDELAYFVEKIGMTPSEALMSATSKAASFSGVDSLGTVQEGKLADLVLLDADPTIDIRNVARIHAVIARGVLLDSATISRILPASGR